jgi:glycosyltransferase involved in cell wall biosynthesis
MQPTTSISAPLDDLSVVLPVHNEAGSIERVLRELHGKVSTRARKLEFVVAEDGSSDGTPAILERLAPELGLRLVSGRARKGYARAVKDALALATRPWIFFTDSDGQHEPDDLAQLVDAVGRERADIAVGVKTPRRDPWPRVALSRGMRIANRLLFGADFHDANCGFRLMRTAVVRELLVHADKLPQFVNAEILLRAWAAGYRVVEVPVRHYARTDGGSRGLPPARIPGEVARLLVGMVAMRGELAAAGHAAKEPAR